jgi:hypothetical protein
LNYSKDDSDEEGYAENVLETITGWVAVLGWDLDFYNGTYLMLHLHAALKN